ncbi:helix-turn-helix domain-containing protein [Nocardiopsis sp. CNT-189]
MSAPLLSASAAADLLGVSPTTIARWVNSGKLAYMRTPAGHRRFSLEVIEQLRAPAEGGAVSSSAAHHRIIRAPHPDMVQVEADPAGTVLIPAPEWRSCSPRADPVRPTWPGSTTPSPPPANS